MVLVWFWFKLVLVGLGWRWFWSSALPGIEGNNVTWPWQLLKMLGARPSGPHSKLEWKIEHNDGGSALGNSIPTKHWSAPGNPPPPQFPRRKEKKKDGWAPRRCGTAGAYLSGRLYYKR